MENVLEITSLRKKYEGFTLNDVSFNLPQGFIMGLIGPNGSGKTTIIKLVMNLIRKEAGQVRIFGKDNIEDEVAVKSRIGFVYDSPPFHGHLNLREIKSIIASFYTNWDDTLFKKYADQFDLPLAKKFKALSRGMKMKFSLAVALSHNADLIILDEPTSGLDPVFRRELLEIFSGIIQDERKSILFSTHITSDLERIADYVTFINEGNIVFSESKDLLMEDWALIKGGKELLNKENRSLFSGIREREFGFEALTSNMKETEKKLKKDIVIEKASLEDIMFFITKGGNNA